MMLFQNGNDFAKYEADTGWREYWVWTGNQEGWKHRSQVFEPTPLNRIYTPPKLDADYGTPEFIQRKKDSTRDEPKEFIKTIKKAKRTVRVIK